MKASPIAELSAKPLQLAMAMAENYDPSLSGVRISPADGQGAVIEAMTSVRLARIVVPEANCSRAVVLPTRMLRMLLGRHRAAQLVSIIDAAEPGQVSVRSFCPVMTAAAQTPEQEGFPALPSLTPTWEASEGEAVSMDLFLLAETLRILKNYAEEVDIITASYPIPLVLKARRDGDHAMDVEIHLARMKAGN